MRPPIYEPKGKAKEYADYAINIYTGCTHMCEYCYAPEVLHKTSHEFSKDVKPRLELLKELKKQLKTGDYDGKEIHLCFSCDPYPKGVKTNTTREVISMLKDAGCHVRILTKNPLAAIRDFDLLDDKDWFGVTITGAPKRIEPKTWQTSDKIFALMKAHDKGIKTWISCEPIYSMDTIKTIIKNCNKYVDEYKFGKLNYRKSNLDWAKITKELFDLIIEYDINATIKDDLIKEYIDRKDKFDVDENEISDES